MVSFVVMDCAVATARSLRLVDPQLLQLVAQRAEGDAQLRGGAGLVVAVVAQGLLDRLALDFLDEAGQGAGGRLGLAQSVLVRIN